MDYAKPKFTREQVNSAARKWSALEPDEDLDGLEKAAEVIDNWRASHSYPLNAFYVTLKRRACKIHSKALAAQRIKRLASITLKLVLNGDMKLTQMQDVGGCRAVMPTIKNVRELYDLYKSKPLAHTQLSEKDYIAEPKSSGYRGIHLKYRFSGKGNSAPYHGMKIEIQLRTLLQHRWATAVEAAATFTKEALKSSRGNKELLRFFSLVSSIFAIREGCPTVPGTPTTVEEITAELKQLDRDYRIVSIFTGYSAILPVIDKKTSAKYFLVILDPVNSTVHIREYKKGESQLANKSYTAAESALPKDTEVQVVLVSVSSIEVLKRAYPNYFLDAQDFLREITNIISPNV